MSSDITEIVDTTAAIAATIPGVKAVFAGGAFGLDDPLRSGQTIRSIGENPTQPFEHWSEVPAAPGLVWQNQDGDVQITWTIPMRLWMLANDAASLRAKALPFYDLYLAAFVPNRLLGGLVKTSRISRFAILADPEAPAGTTRWGWLQVDLEAVEIVRYP